MENILLFGGAFDPIHEGHLSILRSAQALLRPEKMILMPSGNPPHKKGRLSPAKDRYNMCREAAKGFSSLEVSDYEVSGGGRYSLCSVKHVFGLYPEHRHYFLLGMDAYLSFHAWYGWREFGRYTRLLVAPRLLPQKMYKDEARFLRKGGVESALLPAPELNISSGDVRKELRGTAFSSGLPEAVLAYIREKHLYGV